MYLEMSWSFISTSCGRYNVEQFQLSLTVLPLHLVAYLHVHETICILPVQSIENRLHYLHDSSHHDPPTLL